MNLLVIFKFIYTFFWRVEFEMRIVLVEDNQMLARDSKSSFG